MDRLLAFFGLVRTAKAVPCSALLELSARWVETADLEEDMAKGATLTNAAALKSSAYRMRECAWHIEGLARLGAESSNDKISV